MNQETRQCQNCKQSFTIEPDDFTFYEKIKVPPPTFCPECRLQRKLAYRNERRLYKRTCDLCKKSVIAIYPQDAAFPVYCPTCWYSDSWDPLKYGRDYDYTRGFFEQFNELSDAVPHLGMPSPSNNYNSEYTSWVDECKNCYLVFGSSKCEDTLYSELLYDCKNSADSTNCNSLEFSYQCVNSNMCYRCSWCVNSSGCNDCSFCFDCKNCGNCFLSYNQRNKNYLFLNKQYTKEEWQEKMKDILGSHSKTEEAIAEFKKLFKTKAIHKFANIIQTVNSTGSDLIETKNAHYCFDSSKLEDCRYVSYGDKIKDCMDCYAIVEKSELCYENFSTRVTSRCQFMVGSWEGNIDMKYCQFILGGNDLFGCVGLRKNSYCILNKQYTKEEYEALVLKIIDTMKAGGEYGEFFPISISPFGYNETLACDYYPMSKEQALEKGYKWRDDIGGTFGKETISTFELPDNVRDAENLITNEIIACATCNKNFKITPQELAFYRGLNIPIPRRCPDCRYYERLSFKNPRKLFPRKCFCDPKSKIHQNSIEHFHGDEPCSNEFETSYAPDRPEIVYCEQCYQQEVA